MFWFGLILGAMVGASVGFLVSGLVRANITDKRCRP
jgi:hypothetical protein